MRVELLLFLFSTTVLQCKGHLSIIGGVLSAARERIHSTVHDVADTLIGGKSQGFNFGFNGHKNHPPVPPMKDQDETIEVVVEDYDDEPHGPPKLPYHKYPQQHNKFPPPPSHHKFPPPPPPHHKFPPPPPHHNHGPPSSGSDSDEDYSYYEYHDGKPTRPHNKPNSWNERKCEYNNECDHQFERPHHSHHGHFNKPGPEQYNPNIGGYNQHDHENPHQGWNNNRPYNKPHNPNHGNIDENYPQRPNQEIYNNRPFSNPTFTNNQGDLNQGFPPRPNQGFNNNKPNPNKNGNYKPNIPNQGTLNEGNQETPNQGFDSGQFNKPIPPNSLNNENLNHGQNIPNQGGPNYFNNPNPGFSNLPQNINNIPEIPSEGTTENTINDYPLLVSLNPEDFSNTNSAAPKRDTANTTPAAEDDEVFDIDVRFRES